MFVKIIAPNGEYKNEGRGLRDIVEANRDLFLNLNTVNTIHVIGNRLYFDRLRLTFENEESAKNAITVLTEAMQSKAVLTEISQGVVTVKALSGCTVSMLNGCVGETDDGPTKPEPADTEQEPADTEQEQPESVEPTEVTTE